MMIFIGLIALIVLGFANFYIGHRTLLWLKSIFPMVKDKIFWVLYGLIVIFMLLGFALPQVGIIKVMHIISNYWIGVFFYSLLVLILIDLGRIIGKHIKLLPMRFLQSPRTLRITGAVVVLFLFGSVILGGVHAGQLKTVSYPISVEKSCKINALTVVLISDIHINQNTKLDKLKKIVEEVNKNDADIVVIAGDLMDNRSVLEPEKMKALLRSIKSKYGVYACPGNHDVNFSMRSEEKTKDKEPVADFFSDGGIILLKDEMVLVADAFYLVGRRDPHPIGVNQEKRESISEVLRETNRKMPIIMMDHQPVQLRKAAEGGVDVLLSGHTHKGQIFPFSLITDAMFENNYGYLKKGNMVSIVTSGASTWGPPIRIGTDSEIVRIEIEFK